MEATARDFVANARTGLANPTLQSALAKMKVGFPEKRRPVGWNVLSPFIFNLRRNSLKFDKPAEHVYLNARHSRDIDRRVGNSYVKTRLRNQILRAGSGPEENGNRLSGANSIKAVG